LCSFQSGLKVFELDFYSSNPAKAIEEIVPPVVVDVVCLTSVNWEHFRPQWLNTKLRELINHPKGCYYNEIVVPTLFIPALNIPSILERVYILTDFDLSKKTLKLGYLNRKRFVT